MTNEQIIEKLQQIEFVLYSVSAGNHLHPEEVPEAHLTSQELLKHFTYKQITEKTGALTPA